MAENTGAMTINPLSEYLRDGWFSIEAHGTSQWAWSGERAKLCLPSRDNGAYMLEIDGGPVHQIFVTVMHNGKRLFSCSKPRESVHLQIPAGVTTCTIEVEKLWSPQELGSSGDARRLGVCLRRVEPLTDALSHYTEVCVDLPQYIEIGLTSICNMEPPCRVCLHKNSAQQSIGEHLSARILERINPYLNMAMRVSLQGAEGEPFCSPFLFDLLRSLNRQQTNVEFTTNGILLTEKNALRLIQCGLSMINVSLDAACPQTYAKIRGGGRFDEILNNIKRLQKLKTSFGVKTPEVIINMVLMRENIQELPAFITLAHSLGVTVVHIRLLQPIQNELEFGNSEFYENYVSQRIDIGASYITNAIIDAYHRARQLGVAIHCPNPDIRAIFQRAEQADQPARLKNSVTLTIDGPNVDKEFVFEPAIPACLMPWQRCQVRMKGDISFCCWSRSTLGNVGEEMFPYTSIWNGERARSIRREFLQNRIPEGCRMCPALLSQGHAWQGGTRTPEQE